MINFIKIFKFLTILATVNCQSCSSVSGFASYNHLTYATGTWYGVFYQANMPTPLTASCSFGAVVSNATHINVAAQATVSCNFHLHSFSLFLTFFTLQKIA